ncbi:MAG TPA: shikimate dehydrogenase [Chloroflexota bacterium]|nr:shikimate dehydrogenase [Chloroflexota bacterium]
MTLIACVVGHPIAHSLSPAIHNAAFAARGIDASYRAVDVAPGDLRRWVSEARAGALLGFNVTVPHKEAIVPLLDEVTGDARIVGAVNTVVPRPQAGMASESHRLALSGANTDTIGFRQSLAEEAHVSLAGQAVLVLGAGGAARAVALVALQDRATRLVVANRHLERAERLLADLSDAVVSTDVRSVALGGDAIELELSRASVIVNATSVGLRSDDVPIDEALIPRGALVVDLVYNPPETALLRAASRRGARTLRGLGMLIHQAAGAFELWTGQRAPIEAMRSAAERAVLQASTRAG